MELKINFSLGLFLIFLFNAGNIVVFSAMLRKDFQPWETCAQAGRSKAENGSFLHVDIRKEPFKTAHLWLLWLTMKNHMQLITLVVLWLFFSLLGLALAFVCNMKNFKPCTIFG